tara:strand:- start:255 stop:1967 length:1713 start_codon:yes stop_codon:yes gene_type:complete
MDRDSNKDYIRLLNLNFHHDNLGKGKTQKVIFERLLNPDTDIEGDIGYLVMYFNQHDFYAIFCTLLTNEYLKETIPGGNTDPLLDENYGADSTTRFLLGASKPIPNWNKETILKKLNSHLDEETYSTLKKSYSEYIPHQVIDSHFDKLFNSAEKKGFTLVMGKAGVGKSYLIKTACENSDMNVVKVAPTGISAVNIGGQTIHSFFQIPPNVINPFDTEFKIHKNVKYRTLDFLVIDEISMVQSYLLDAIDVILKKNNNSDLPFGGKKVYMFGDLFQLQPITPNDNEAKMFLKDNYNGGIWFFDSKVLSDSPQYWDLGINLMIKPRRHTQAEFLRFLDIIRKGKVNLDDKEFFKICCDRLKQNVHNDNTIYLVQSNKIAKEINEQKLKTIKTRIIEYKAKIKGDWEIESYPNDVEISLKEGAKVIFIKNNREMGYVNGEQGEIKKLSENKIIVKKLNKEIVEVSNETWEKLRYVYDPETKKLTTEVIGTFTQIPLKLGWAMTIHRSQGMTLEHITLDFSQRMFTKGMLYVALSRVKTFDNIYISRGELNTGMLDHSAEVQSFLMEIGVAKA